MREKESLLFDNQQLTMATTEDLATLKMMLEGGDISVSVSFDLLHFP